MPCGFSQEVFGSGAVLSFTGRERRCRVCHVGQPRGADHQPGPVLQDLAKGNTSLLN